MMHLMLAVETYRGSAPVAPLECRFGAAGGTIGRGPENTMVLPDAARTVSRVHARIDYIDGGWRLADLGSNPSRQNGRPLAAGASVRLAGGDMLDIGGYRLIVRVMECAPAQAFDAPFGVHDRRSLEALDVASPMDCAVEQAYTPDALAHAAVLADCPLLGPRFDPLGELAANAREASTRLGGQAAFVGSESDHVSPEQFAFVPPAGVKLDAGVKPHAPAHGIPHDYDPLDGVVRASCERAAQPPISEPVLHTCLAHAAETDKGACEPCFAALLDGMGIDSGALRGRNTADVARLAGTMLRTAMRGVVDVLLSRSVLKREISLETTMLVQRDNNPLKFFPTGDGALAQMLCGANAGYLPAQTALEGAFDDIRRHEVAVLEGTRAAMQHLLGRFDPQAIARDDTQRRWFDWLPACRKARRWDRLVALHAQLARASADDLQALCGSAFNDAYERQANGCTDAMPLAPSIR